MRILQLKDIERKDLPIYYRRMFSATAVIDLLGEQLERRIEFSIETKPTGMKDTTIKLMEDVEYPLVPLIRQLKETVMSMDKTGVLP